MSIITIRTGEIIEEVQRAMLKNMTDIFRMAGLGVMAPGGRWIPATDIYETEKGFVILADVAGVNRESLDITLHNDLIRISGTREGWSSSEHKRFHQMEIAYGTFERILQLPSTVDSDKAEASYTSGLLIISLPKTPRKTYQVEIT